MVVNPKKWLAALVIFLICSQGAVQAQQEAGPIGAPYSADEVAKNVYVIQGPLGFPNSVNQGFMNNPVFVVTTSGVVVIDPGSSVQSGRMVLGEIEKITDQPVVGVFATHIHGDHWLGNQAIREKYPDAMLMAHPNLIAEAESGRAQFWVDLMDQLTEGATRGTVAVIPDTPVDDGQVMEFGESSVTVIHKGKAHTNTDIVVWIQPANVMVTGDLVFNNRVGLMDDGSFTGLVEFLTELEGMNPQTVVPGHGATGDISLITNSRRFHGIIYDTVETLYEDGMPDFEMKPRVQEALIEFADWDGFEDGIGRLISLSYLEVEENNF